MKMVGKLLTGVGLAMAMGGHVSASAQTPDNGASDSPSRSASSGAGIGVGSSCCTELPARTGVSKRGRGHKAFGKRHLEFEELFRPSTLQLLEQKT